MLAIVVLGSMFLYVYSKRNITRLVVDYPITERAIGLEIANLQRFGLKAPTNATVSEQEEAYQNARKRAIENLTNFYVVLQHAKDTDFPEPTSEEIDERIDMVLEMAGMEIDEYLAEGGVSMGEFKEQVRNQLIFEGITYPIMEDVNEPNHVELNQFYETNKASYIVPENVDYQQIVVPDMETHDEVMQKLADGTSFEDLAKEYSTDTATKDNGGLYKAVMKAAISDIEVANSFFPPSPNFPSVEVGVAQGIITQKSGVIIVKLLAKHPEQDPGIDGSFKLWDEAADEYVEVPLLPEITNAWKQAQGQGNVTTFVRRLSDKYESQIYDRVAGNMPWDGLEQFFGKLLGASNFNRIMGFVD